MTSALVPFSGSRPSDAAIDDAVQLLIAGRRSPNTRAAYQRDWQLWCEFAARKNAPLADPGLPAATSFRELLVGRYSGPSVSRILGSLSFFYKALQAAGACHTNPFLSSWLARPAGASTTANRTPTVAPDIADAILTFGAKDTSPTGVRNYAILRLLYDTGMRRASAATLQRDAVNRDSIAIVVKGGRTEPVALPATCSAALQKWLAIAPPSIYVFPNKHYPSRPINVAIVNRVVAEAAAGAGVAHVHPHMFRATFITDAYDAKMYERDIQAAAHHADAATTRRYDRGRRGDKVVLGVAEYRRGRK